MGVGMPKCLWSFIFIILALSALSFTGCTASQKGSVSSISGPASTLSVSTAPQKMDQALPTGYVNIISKVSGKCMDVPYWDGSDWGQQVALRIQQWDCWGGDNQQFQIIPVSGGYQIISKISGQSFDMAGGPDGTYDANGAGLIQYPYWGGSNEIFT